MNILLLTLLCVYVHYNALGQYIKLFALYKNIFFMKVIKTEIRFSTTENRFSKKSGFNMPTVNLMSGLQIITFLVGHCRPQEDSSRAGCGSDVVHHWSTKWHST